MLEALKLHTLPLTNLKYVKLCACDCMQVASPTLLHTYTLLLTWVYSLILDTLHSLHTDRSWLAGSGFSLRFPRALAHRVQGSLKHTFSSFCCSCLKNCSKRAPADTSNSETGFLSFREWEQAVCFTATCVHSPAAREKDENPVTWQRRLPPHLLLVLSDTLKPWPGSRQSVDTNTNEPPAKGDITE